MMLEQQAEATQAAPPAAEPQEVLVARLVQVDRTEEMGPTAARVKCAGASMLREITCQRLTAPVQ